MSSDDSVPKTRTVTKPQARVVAPPPDDGDATVIRPRSANAAPPTASSDGGNNLPVGTSLGEFELTVLLTLLRLGTGTWGAAIRRDIQERTTRELPVSVVYVTLQRLEKKGMVRSYVGNPSAERGGRRRRHYLIDVTGEQALGRSFRAFRTLTAGLEARLESL